MQISWITLLLFILLPLVYVAIRFNIIKDFDEELRYLKYGRKKGKKFYVFQILSLILYYLLEIIMVLYHHHLSGEWIILKNQEISGSIMFCFVFCYVLFLVFHMIGLIASSHDTYNYDIPYHCIPLIIFFIIFLWLTGLDTKDIIKKNHFDSIQYQLTNESTIPLHVLSDTHTTSGEVHGGRYYVNGTINDNYDIYYAYLDKDKSLVIEHFTYSKGRDKIYPEENCENPRIVIRTYSKQYEDLTASYNAYELHIPDNSVSGLELDMQ